MAIARRRIACATVLVVSVAACQDDLAVPGTRTVPAAPVEGPVAPVSETPSLDPGPSTFAAASRVLLDVRHQRQTQTGCSTDNWCCGLASANMATAYLWGASPSSSFLLKGTSLLGLNTCCHKLSNPSSKGTNVWDQARFAQQVGNAKSSQPACFTFTNIKTFLSAGYPVPVSLVYGNVPPPYSCLSTFKGRHSVIVIGYDEAAQTWTVNDPLCTYGKSTWPSTVFRSAVRAAGTSTCEIEGVFVAK